jgi:alpha-D-xyloside xylohydrolase
MAALAAALAVACGEPRGELAVAAGPARIVSSAGGARGALERDGRRLLGLDRDAFVLGVSRAIDPERGYDPFWLVHPEPLVRTEPPEGLRWLRPVASSARLEGADIVIELGYGMDMRAEVRVTPVAAGRWRLRWTSRGPLPVAYHRLDLGIDPEEEMYGLGEWFDQPFHRGKRRSMQLEPDLRLEGASNEAHVPIPFILGTSGWGVLVRSERYGVFDVGADDPARLRITYGSAGEVNGLEAFVFAEASPLDLTRHYHEVTGRPALPAEWAYGPWIWRDESRDQAEVEADIRRIRDLDLPTSAIWIDRPYASAVNSFDFAPERYDDPEGMIRAARRAGLRVALWHTPYLEEKTGALRERALREGWFPPQVGFRANPWSEILDFTNPAARAWWQERLGRRALRVALSRRVGWPRDAPPVPRAVSLDLRRAAPRGGRLPPLPRRPVGRAGPRLGHLAGGFERQLRRAPRASRRRRARRGGAPRRGVRRRRTRPERVPALRIRHRRVSRESARRGDLHPMVSAHRVLGGDAGGRQLESAAVGLHARKRP